MMCCNIVLSEALKDQQSLSTENIVEDDRRSII